MANINDSNGRMKLRQWWGVVVGAINALNRRIDNIITHSGTSSTEVVDARNAPGATYSTLKERLDAQYAYLLNEKNLVMLPDGYDIYTLDENGKYYCFNAANAPKVNSSIVYEVTKITAGNTIIRATVLQTREIFIINQESFIYGVWTRIGLCDGTLQLGFNADSVDGAHASVTVSPYSLSIRDGLGNINTNDVVLSLNRVISGGGSPEGVIVAPPGSVFLRNDSGTGDLYVKQSGFGNTGWVVK